MPKNANDDYKDKFPLSLIEELKSCQPEDRIDLGCIAAHGIFSYEQNECEFQITTTEKAATVFLFELIARLQEKATVPMIDVRAYAQWLK